MSKHYVIVAHGRIMKDQTIIFSPINRASQLYFHVNEGCILSTYPRPGESDPSSEIKKTICSQQLPPKDITQYGESYLLPPKDITQYGESYLHMLLSPFIKSSEIVIQDCSSKTEENIIKIKEHSYLYNIIHQIESYHKHNYPTEPYILHIFACRIYHGDALPAPALARSISGNHDEQIIFYFTGTGYGTYIQTILALPDLEKEKLLILLSSIITKEKHDIITANNILRINSDEYDLLVSLGEQLGLKKTDIDLNMIKQSLEKKRGSIDKDPFFHPIPVSSQGAKRVRSYEQKYIKYKTKYLNLKKNVLHLS
jgi:hypothetical protein